MPTVQTKKVGATNSPTTMDYTSLASFISAMPSSLVTADEQWNGEFYDQGELTAAGTQSISNSADATRYLSMYCVAGASFKDKAGVRTTALTYNASNGVAYRKTANYGSIISCSSAYIRIVGMQFKGDGTANNGVLPFGGNTLFQNNIVRMANTSTSLLAVGDTSGGKSGQKYINNLIITNGGHGLADVSTDTQFHGNTVISSAGTQTGLRSYPYSSSAVVRNNAIFGFGTAWSGNAGTTGGGYNATDLASGLPGSSNQYSLTFSSQFVSTTVDFRAVDTGSLDLNGTPDATNIPTDISGTTRHATTPTIGCWEVIAAAAASNSMKPLSIPSALLCM